MGTLHFPTIPVKFIACVHALAWLRMPLMALIPCPYPKVSDLQIKRLFHPFPCWSSVVKHVFYPLKQACIFL